MLATRTFARLQMTIMPRGAERQEVRARSIENSIVEQFIGDKYIVSPDLTNANIYLTYADSDVQALYLGGDPHGSRRYMRALDETIRLLLCFKPPASAILLSPSSVVQSRLTREILIPYLRQDAEAGLGHILLLRREPTWAEYFAKRQQDTRLLQRSDGFADYSSLSVIHELTSLPASRKKFFSGAGTIDLWTESVSRVTYRSSLAVEQISEAAHDALQSEAFVFETSLKTLERLKVALRPSDARSILIDAYVGSVAQGCTLPTAIRLPWDPCPASSGQRSLSITTLYRKALEAGVWETILGFSPAGVLRFAGSTAMGRVRNMTLLDSPLRSLDV